MRLRERLYDSWDVERDLDLERDISKILNIKTKRSTPTSSDICFDFIYAFDLCDSRNLKLVVIHDTPSGWRYQSIYLSKFLGLQLIYRFNIGSWDIYQEISCIKFMKNMALAPLKMYKKNFISLDFLSKTTNALSKYLYIH